MLLAGAILIVATYTIRASASQRASVHLNKDNVSQLDVQHGSRDRGLLFEKPMIFTSTENTQTSTPTPPVVTSQSSQAQTSDSAVKQNAAIRINGEAVKLPKSGELRQEIHSGGNTATIELSVSSNNTTSSRSSIDIDVQSSTDTTRSLEG